MFCICIVLHLFIYWCSCVLICSVFLMSLYYIEVSQYEIIFYFWTGAFWSSCWSVFMHKSETFESANFGIWYASFGSSTPFLLLKLSIFPVQFLAWTEQLNSRGFGGFDGWRNAAGVYAFGIHRSTVRGWCFGAWSYLRDGLRPCSYSPKNDPKSPMVSWKMAPLNERKRRYTHFPIFYEKPCFCSNMYVLICLFGSI